MAAQVTPKTSEQNQRELGLSGSCSGDTRRGDLCRPLPPLTAVCPLEGDASAPRCRTPGGPCSRGLCCRSTSPPFRLNRPAGGKGFLRIRGDRPHDASHLGQPRERRSRGPRHARRFGLLGTALPRCLVHGEPVVGNVSAENADAVTQV